MNIIDIVTMNESIFSRVIKTPLRRPLPAPKASAMGPASQGDSCQRSRHKPKATVVMLPMAPTDRFIPPTTRHMACDRAIRM